MRVVDVDNGLVPSKHLVRDYCENNEEAEILNAGIYEDGRCNFHNVASDLEEVINPWFGKAMVEWFCRGGNSIQRVQSLYSNVDTLLVGRG
ncbi:hypothetical protein N7463_001248 [Penicillium fimorum]|uniref:Uncharacterized protein n=1 Tax=Penicillium fimorum TaxID=1882269 RepID=A0A9X0CBU8_9EURO|nr:hypothetical protein N7463_001248 [Penicillium fimorum]